MEFNNSTSIESFLNESNPLVAQKFIAGVFKWMFIALAISSVTAYFASQSQDLINAMFDASGHRSILGTVILFSPLAFVLTMSFGFQRLSLPLLTLIFVAYSALTGISFSFILLIYSGSSIVSCFSAAAIMFGIMAFMGYRTEKDLTSFGRLMMMGLIGIVVASLINMFIGSDKMGYITSVIGILVFTGLTAYDVQKIKNMALTFQENGTDATLTSKASIMGALTLYLDFINLFLSLLRVFGKKR